MKATIYKVVAQTLGDTVTAMFPTLKSSNEYVEQLHAAIIRTEKEQQRTLTANIYKLVSYGGEFNEVAQPIDTITLYLNKF